MIKRNNGAVEKLAMEISCRISVKPKLENEKI